MIDTKRRMQIRLNQGHSGKVPLIEDRYLKSERGRDEIVIAAEGSKPQGRRTLRSGSQSTTIFSSLSGINIKFPNDKEKRELRLIPAYYEQDNQCKYRPHHYYQKAVLRSWFHSQRKVVLKRAKPVYLPSFTTGSVTADSLPPTRKSITQKRSNQESQSAWPIPLNHKIKQENEPRELPDEDGRSSEKEVRLVEGRGVETSSGKSVASLQIPSTLTVHSKNPSLYRAIVAPSWFYAIIPKAYIGKPVSKPRRAPSKLTNAQKVASVIFGVGSLRSAIPAIPE
ncbi:hypothetical protein M9H77_23632 [Catharanthus roseus]|uniref:Uncharacterized protein n=1 Tax=Catharanthus roseus TaxID=4058 RepID=A0ACC0AUT7_CATRO|nr:hypothetical protein M9H77_23632 [Catharanthus roseus]